MTRLQATALIESIFGGYTGEFFYVPHSPNARLAFKAHFGSVPACGLNEAELDAAVSMLRDVVTAMSATDRRSEG